MFSVTKQNNYIVCIHWLICQLDVFIWLQTQNDTFIVYGVNHVINIFCCLCVVADV